jgi:iron complex outermembrane recepter protein
MMQSFKLALLATVALGSAVPQAFAQTAGSQPEADEVGAIIITARRVEERLQDVPASVSVLTADALAQTGAKVAKDFVQLTPGVTIVTGTAEAGDTQVNIRGLNGARDAENNVAVVVDGVLKTQVAAINQNQGSIQQVEVLKGPQGAIYGRNAAAGAIVITTKKPTDVFEFDGKAGFGNNQTYSIAATARGPIAPGVGFVLGFDFDKTDGQYRNDFLPSATNRSVFPNNSTEAASMDDRQTWNINGRLLFNLGDATEIDLKGRYGQSKGGSILFNAVFQIPGLFDVPSSVGLGEADSNIDVNNHRFRFTPNIDPNNDQSTAEASLRISHELGFGQLVGYVSYSNIKNDFFADGTSGSFQFFDANATCVSTRAGTAGFVVQEPFQTIGGFRSSQPYGPSTCDGTQYQVRNQEDISAEIRLVGDADNLRWQIGGYFLHINRRVCVNLGLDTGQGVIEQCFTTDARNPTEGLADDTFKTNVYAAFGSVDYEPIESLTFGAALRYDVEERDVSNNVPTGRRTRWVGNFLTGNGFGAACGSVPGRNCANGTATSSANYFLNPGLDPIYNPSGVLGPRSASFKQLQPKISLTYEPTPQLTAFANWGIGFKSGGFNASGSQAVLNGFFNNGTALFAPGNPIRAGLTISDQYRKERTSSFEVGFKGTAFEGGLSYEIAGYYTDVKDMQFFEFFVGPFGLLRVVSNIDKVTLKGVEASGNVRITRGWNVFASANFTDSKIKANRARPVTVGNKSPYTANYTINVGSQITAPLMEGIDLSARADVRVTGPTWFHTVQNNSVPNFFFGDNVLEGNFNNSRRNAFTTANLRVTLEGSFWSVSAFANNLLDEDYLAEVIPAPEFGGDFISPGARRSFGLELGLKF